MKIWYDISGLYGWQGNFTGIQRIVYNLGRHLNEDAAYESGFFIFEHGNFTEVAWEEVEARLVVAKLSKPFGSDTPKASLAYVRHHGLLLAKGAVRDSALEKPLRKIYSGLRSRQVELAAPHPASRLFATDDTVIVVDGNWQFSGFAETIRAAKKNTNFKLLHFVNDIVAIKNPALASRDADKIIGDYFKKILPVTDSVVCISESTKKDVLEVLPSYVKNTDIQVIELGSNALSIQSTEKPNIELPSEFILAVSTIEVRKNYLLMYYVYKKSIADGVELPNLVIVGKKGWMVEDVYNLITKDPEVSKKISLVSGISDNELEWLYANCKFTVFPSFYEGWGIPIAESLSRGKLCISSDTSSMPEVGKDLVVYASPYDPQRWLDIMKNLDDKKLNKLEQKIKQDYKPVLWRDTYGQLINSIRQL